jgi:hypothetical protein
MRELNDAAAADGVYFQYRGYFSQPMIEQSIGQLGMRAQADKLDSAAHRRLINAFIEVSQNIVHYSCDALTEAAAKDDEIRFGSIEICEAGGAFLINSSNPVGEDDARRLNERLTALVELDQAALKAQYHQALNAESEPQSKGGGIGFLRLARGSSAKLQFSFVDVPVDPEIKIFNLTVTVQKP